jgi:multidrug transporter EmrE-like cation transporter
MTFLAITVVTDVAGVVLLGKAHGLERPGFLVAGILALLLGFITFSYATRTIPTGLANAVWGGSSLVLVVVLGVVFLREPFTVPQYVCLGLIVAGTLGVYLLGPAPVS